MRKTLSILQRMPRDFWIYIIAWGFLGFAYFGIFGVLFNLYLLRLGYGPEQIGLLTGAGQLMWGLSAIPAGMVGVRIGNRTALIWGMAILTAATVMVLLGEVLPAAFQNNWIAVWWIGSWIGSALIIVNGAPYVMAVCEADTRPVAFSLQQVATGICGFAGSLAAGILPGIFAEISHLDMDSPTSYWYALWLAPLFYLGGTLVMMLTTPRQAVVAASLQSSDEKLPVQLLLFVGLLVFLQTFGEGAIRAFFNVYLDAGLDVSLARIGTIMGIGQFLPILSSLAAVWVLGRIGTAQTIIWCGVAYALSMLILAVFGNWFAASTGYITMLSTISVAGIARSLFSQEIVAPRWRTHMSTLFTMGLALGWSLAAGVGGYIISIFGFSTLFVVGAFMALFSTVLVGGYLRLASRTKASQPVATQPVP